MSDLAAGPDAAGEGGAQGRYGHDLKRVLGAVRTSERVGVLVEHLRWLVGEVGFPWISELARVGKAEKLSAAEVRDLTSELAWASREAGEQIPAKDTAPIGEVDKDVYGLVLAYVRAQRLRFDFKFRELLGAVEEWRREYHDALFLSMAAFASCGLRLPDGLTLYKKSIEAEDADKVSRHVSLTAIWMAQHVENQGTLLLELAEDMITRGEADAVLYFRRSRAFAQLGDYERAVDDIHRAMDLTPPDNNRVHADYFHEWQNILARWDTERWARKLTEEVRQATREEAEEGVKQVEKALSDGQTRMVEVLGLFLGLVGFLLASGTAVVLIKTWEQAIAAVTLSGAGFVGFFVVLRWVVHYKRKGEK
ncbi:MULTISPECIES: hypothetical protein [unclassified Nonomuraea]|uniref:hypothetical protein n=1 Tax=unclassified Nonomuraea TaxID=2593643 RepID=UPI0033D54B17